MLDRRMTYSLRIGLTGYGVLVTMCAGAFAIVGTLGSTQGCGICECASPGAFVEVSPDRAADVAQVTATGATCVATTRCDTPSGSTCIGFVVAAQQPGVCHIQVTFTSGAAPITSDVEFRQSDGCCSGLYPVSGQGLIRVPAASSADAGADVNG